MKAHLLTVVLIIGTMGLGLKSTSTMAQTIVYVKADGTGNGTSWANACNIDDVFGKNAPHPITSPNTEVWVQKGTYTPSRMLTIPANVKMYGSFNGTESSLGARSVVDHSTVIDAQQKYGSVVHLGESALLDGFTIKNGSAQWNPRRNGGGVYAEDSSTIANCFIIDNVAGLNGGGVYAREVAFISNTTIENNTATDLGNEIYGCCIAIDGGQCLAPFICSHPSPKAETRTNLKDIGFASLSVSAVGTGPLTYEWFSNTENSTEGGTLVGTDSVYTPSHQYTDTKYYYYAVVTGACGTDTSAVSGLHTVTPLTFDYTGAPATVMLDSGTYIIECWGARGGPGVHDGKIPAVTTPGQGAYTKGTVTLKASTTLNVYVGQAGLSPGTGNKSANVAGGWNGGGISGNDRADNDHGGSGGGATDIRTTGGAWSDMTSLRSRVMVAAGGAGSSYSIVSAARAAGAGLSSADGSNAVTQTTGYSFGTGKAGMNNNTSNVPTFGSGGGGGGYYGGTTGPTSETYSTGGTSFISGHPGCNAVKIDGTHAGIPNHYSGVIFTDTQMIAGNASMPNPRGTGNITGNSGHGFVQISRVK